MALDFRAIFTIRASMKNSVEREWMAINVPMYGRHQRVFDQAINNLIFNAYFHYSHSMELAQLNGISSFMQCKERNIFSTLLAHTHESAWKFVNLPLNVHANSFFTPELPCVLFQTTCSFTMAFTIPPASTICFIQWALKSMFTHSK